MPVINHIHTYIKYKGREGFFRCNSPDCMHYIEKDAILNKLSLCSECGNQMILTREDLRRARPKCINCSDTKKAKNFRKAQELTRYLGTESFTGLHMHSTIHDAIEDQEPDIEYLKPGEEQND